MDLYSHFRPILLAQVQNMDLCKHSKGWAG